MFKALLGGLLLLSSLLEGVDRKTEPLGDFGLVTRNGEEIDAKASNPVLLVPKGVSGPDDGPATAEEKAERGFEDVPELLVSVLA